MTTGILYEKREVCKSLLSPRLCSLKSVRTLRSELPHRFFEFYAPILVTVLSKELVCRLWPAGIVGSNPAGARTSVMSVLCCQVEVSVMGRTLIQRIPTACVCVSLNVIRCNNNTLHLQWVSRRGQNKKERKEKELYKRKFSVFGEWLSSWRSLSFRAHTLLHGPVATLTARKKINK